jgi:hypothetical protein
VKRSYAKDVTHRYSCALASPLLCSARPQKHARTTPFSAIQAVVLAALAACVMSVSGVVFAADSIPGGNTKSLDEQVQEIKSDVLAIAAELNNLEERLLYPSNTQIAVFVSLEEGQTIEIDSARISIDGNLVSHHIYSFKELEALEKGGVQRIYTGNVQTGEHRLEVAISNKRNLEQNSETIKSFVFNKEIDPKLVGITLGGGVTGSATIAIKDW